MNSETTIKRILILAANPKGTKKLRLDEETREIRERLRLAKNRDKFQVESAVAVRYRDIQQHILDFEPNIIHFSGHGAGEEGLVFEDNTGQEKLVDAGALADLFSIFEEQIEAVILNACYSEIQAKAIAQHIDYVIGMNQAIDDKAAIEFAIGFYNGLGAGKTVEIAYRLGCNLIRTAGISDYLIPILKSRHSSSTIQDLSPVEIVCNDQSNAGIDYKEITASVTDETRPRDNRVEQKAQDGVYNKFGNRVMWRAEGSWISVLQKVILKMPHKQWTPLLALALVGYVYRSRSDS